MLKAEGVAVEPKKSHNDAMRAFGAVVIVLGFVAFSVCVAIYWTGYQAKRLASKQGRQEIKAEIIETANFVAKDKDFRKEVNEGSRGTYIVVGLVVIALIASALGLG